MTEVAYWPGASIRTTLATETQGEAMRIALLILGAILLLQTVIRVLTVATTGPFSFEAVGAEIDKDLVRLTTALCALSLARLLRAQAK